ncbi:phosphate signaling complex protein PhoU [Methanobacterium petrolearium]|uniref:phosphate signaling complex protein PhoU n=1 Tax=Methanobacterium petrolearium TaxID=710190 RepID=UPI001AE2583E|nr:phosphate signaling complex protein PhoU [Methanobacterium petrolearium]MBP1945967.1 phosphate transport system protein [Methanobacterium petrolearium]BDZ72215.1 PhoU family transcriptional regulator [Methanobacterium petrolearium]
MKKGYPRVRFQKRLDELKNEVDKMGQAALKAYRDAFSTFIDYDVEVVNNVMETNKKVHEMGYQVEHDAMGIIAAEQPVAGDLRFIETSIKVSSHLKRISGLASNIAEVASHVKDEEIPEKPMFDLQRMADIVDGMVSKSLAAFLGKNMAVARELHRDDDKVDDLFDQALKDITKSMFQDKESISYSIYLLFLARFLERIADRAENIGDRTIFMITCEKLPLIGEEKD